MLTWRWVVLGAMSLAACGCEEPAAIVPAGPPGSDLQRKLPESETKDPAAALGEQAPSTRGTDKANETMKIEPAPPTAKGETRTTAAGIKYETVKEGTGPEAKVGQKVRVHYTGTLDDGTKFDSSRDRGEPFSFTIGKHEVILGWDEGVPGMKVGEQRKLTIPPAAGYGASGQGKVPANATLHFDIELMGVD